MYRQARIASLAAALLLTGAAAANATPTISITYTADNVVNALYYQMDGGPLVDISSSLGANFDDWKKSDELIFDSSFADLSGSHEWSFIWQLQDTGWQEGFLAQIVFSGFSSDPGEIITSPDASIWTAASDISFSSLSPVVSYGQQLGASPWYYNMGMTCVSGIDPAAEWIWASGAPDTTYIRASFSTEASAAPVPEPTSLLLLGTGLSGLGLLGRKRKMA